MPFSDACIEEGVQPIVGTLLGVARPGRSDGQAVIDWLALYAQDETGYRNLCALVSSAHLDRPIEDIAHVPFDALAGRTDGLIALTAGAKAARAAYLGSQNDAAARCWRASRGSSRAGSTSSSAGAAIRSSRRPRRP